MKPPVAKRVPQSSTRHGRTTEDDYGWLRERADPGVMQYLEAENAYTAEVMKPTEELQELVYREIRGRIKESDRTVPVRIGPYDYYTRTVEGRQYSVHCRRPAGSDAEQVILDENELARELTYFRLGALAVSPDHKLLAYSFDRDGGEKYVLCFKNLETGEKLEDTIRGTYTSVEWAADSRTVFYNTLDETHRPYRLYRHSLGQDPAADELVFQEDDASFFLGLYKTKSKRFLMLELESNSTSEVLFLEATRGLARCHIREGLQHGPHGFFCLGQIIFPCRMGLGKGASNGGL